VFLADVCYPNLGILDDPRPQKYYRFYHVAFGVQRFALDKYILFLVVAYWICAFAPDAKLRFLSLAILDGPEQSASYLGKQVYWLGGRFCCFVLLRKIRPKSKNSGYWVIESYRVCYSEYDYHGVFGYTDE